MTTRRLIAYHGNQWEKDAILAQLRAHRAADEITQGQYWEDGKGCAVGCTLHGDDHSEYESRFGIPQMLAHLEDHIFEGLPPSVAVDWPVRLMDAIVPGADLSRVGWQFLHWLLTDETINPGINHPIVRNVVRQSADIMASLGRGAQVDLVTVRDALYLDVMYHTERVARDPDVDKAASLSAWSAWGAVRAAWCDSNLDTRGEGGAGVGACVTVANVAKRGEPGDVMIKIRDAVYVRVADELIALISSTERASPWQRFRDVRPEHGTKCVVKRGDDIFTATAMYGTHAPWWFIGGERPFAIQDDDQWLRPEDLP